MTDTLHHHRPDEPRGGCCCSASAADLEQGTGAPAAAVKDPVCGMTVDPSNTGHQADHAGATYHFCCGGCRSRFVADPARYLASASVKDPVCGMTVDPSTTRHQAEHDGIAYHFCSAGCRNRFTADPASFLSPAPSRPAPPIAGAIYTCPMHPEVRQAGPGACPICGMALEPDEVTADAGPNPELADMTRRTWIGAAGALPVVMLAMAGDLLGDRFPLVGETSNAIQLGFATFVVFWAGLPFFERGWRSVVTRHLNMFTLVAIGTGVAWSYSTIATLLPGLFPPALRQPDGSVGVYFEAAAVITVLVLLGQVLELRARDSTSAAIRGLLDLAPKMARRIAPDGTEGDVPLSDIVVGDHVRVRPGETVPVDGTIAAGSATIDQARVTGESLPVSKQQGDAVIGGTVSRTGSLVIRAEKVGRDTLLARIVQLVAEAQRSRAPIQRLADRVSGLFVPVVLLAAAAAFAAWFVLGPEPRLAHAVIAAVSVLIIACPCALGLATPMSIMVGMGRGASAGVLIRNADVLERLEKVDTVVLDKTGTLTEGKPAVRGFSPAGGSAEDEVLGLAASLERGSEHPLARALVEAATARGLAMDDATGFEAPTGKGVRGQVGGRDVLVGSQAFLRDHGIDASPLSAAIEDHRGQGATAVLVAVEGRLAGVFGVADRVRSDGAAVVLALKSAGLQVVMLTGDTAATAKAIAGPLGIDEIEADVLPDAKARTIERLKRQGRIVAMAGDGVNDAPALALADVGVAMGTGTDIAMASAGMTLLGGDLAGLMRARRLSVATMGNIRQNLLFAFLYNGIGVPVAAGVLYPAFGLVLSPMLAAAAMALSSVSVIANALRLRTVDLG